MHLLLDLGNTRIKWALAEAGQLGAGGELVHREHAPAAVAAGLAAELAAVVPRGTDMAAFAVNVAGEELGAAVQTAVSEACGCRFTLVDSRVDWGELRCGYTDRTQLGADRWAAIVAAWQPGGGDVCIVDAGTAVTVDLLRDDGRHLGGIIVPGLDLMVAALGQRTADIASHAAGQAGPGEGDWYGRSTAEAVVRGARFSLVATVQRALAEFPARQRPVAPRLVLTGGDAAELARLIPGPVELRPQLVLEGVLRLAGAIDA
jgi:type III pantothenate kinase